MKQFAFIPGYTDPVFFALCTVSPSNLSKVVKRCVINLRRKEASLNWQSVELPFFFEHLIPMPSGGMVLQGMKVLYYFHEQTSFNYTFDQPIELLTWKHLDANRLLLATVDGDFFIVSFVAVEKEFSSTYVTTTEMVTSLLVTKVANLSFYSSSICFSNNLMFCASKMHDSSLFEMIQEADEFSLVEKERLESMAGATNSLLYSFKRYDNTQTENLLVACGYGSRSKLARVQTWFNPLQLGQLELSRSEGPTAIFVVELSIGSCLFVSFTTHTMIFSCSANYPDITAQFPQLSLGATLHLCVMNGVCIRAAIDSVIAYTLDLTEDKELLSAPIIQADICEDLYSVCTTESISVFRVTSFSELTPLASIDNRFTATCMCSIRGKTIFALVNEQDQLELHDAASLNLLITYDLLSSGPACLATSSVVDLPITDPSQLVTIMSFAMTTEEQVTQVCLVDCDLFVLLLAVLSSNEILIYCQDSESNFTRESCNCYLGPTETGVSTLVRQIAGDTTIVLMNHPLGARWLVYQKGSRSYGVHTRFTEISGFACMHTDAGWIWVLSQETHLKFVKLEDEFAYSAQGIVAYEPLEQTARHLAKHGDWLFMSQFTEGPGGVQYSISIRRMQPDGTWTEQGCISSLNPNEIIMTMTIVDFKRAVRKHTVFLAVGTGLLGFEDSVCEGQIMLFCIEGDNLVFQPITWLPGLKGPVTLLAPVEGYLFAGINNELKVLSYVEDDQIGLEPIAFHYTFSGGVCIDVRKNLIMLCETRYYTQVLMFREGGNRKDLTLVAQQHKHINPVAVSFSPESFRQVLADDMRNIHLFTINGNSSRLEKIGDFHTGISIQSFAKHAKGLFVVGLEGGISYLTACDEFRYKKMHTLQNALSRELPYVGGLNPRSYRLANCEDRERQRKNVLDARQLFSYCSLSHPLQRSIARGIGTTPQHILSELAVLFPQTKLGT